MTMNIDLNAYGPENVLVIAEAGCNHQGEPKLADALVDAAANAGADFVKFQTFDPARMIVPAAPKADYQLRATGNAESQYDRLVRLRLSRADHERLMARASERGVGFCSSVFDEPSLDLLLSLGVPLLKVPSGEITNLPLLQAVGNAGLPVILSTGMADLAEISEALEAMKNVPQVALLHCVSAYPSRMEDANLRAMETLRREFGLPMGFSDHSQGWELPLAAVAMGAAIIEKHITLDRTLEGGDHLASLEPDDFGRMTAAIRGIGTALGSGEKQCTEAEKNVRDVARKSVVTLTDIGAGEALGPENLGLKRPGTGMAPKHFEELCAMRAARPLGAHTLLSWSDVCK